MDELYQNRHCMKLGKLQDKLDQLYKDVDLTDIKHNDEKLLMHERITFGVRAKYDLGIYILRSPGNDLLKYYDNIMLEQDPKSKSYSYIPPSIVFYYRFKHQYPKKLSDKSFNYGKATYLRDCLVNYYNTDDTTYWNQILKDRYNWLVDKPHDKFEFTIIGDLKKFCMKNFGQYQNPKDINVKGLITNTNEIIEGSFHHMWWRGKFAGWSCEFVPKDLGDPIWKKFKLRTIKKYEHKKIVEVDLTKKYYSRFKIIMTPNGPFFGLEEASKSLKQSIDKIKQLVYKKNKDVYEISSKQYLKYCITNNIKPLI